jgi:hypothetical protein
VTAADGAVGVAYVTGTVDVSGTTAPTLNDLNAVREIGGSLVVSSTATLMQVALPSLTSVGGDLRIAGDANVAAVQLPTLKSIGGVVVVEANPALAGVFFAPSYGLGGSAAGVDLTIRFNSAALSCPSIVDLYCDASPTPADFDLRADTVVCDVATCP